MHSAASGSDVYRDHRYPQHRPPFAISRDEQFTVAATYLASLQPSHPHHAHDERPPLPHAAEPSYPAPPPSSSSLASLTSLTALFDARVHACIAAAHSAASASSQPPHHQPPHAPYADSCTFFQPLGSQWPAPPPLKHETAADATDASNFYSPTVAIDATMHSAAHEQRQHTAASSAVAPLRPLSEGAMSALSASAVVSVFAQPRASAEPFSVPPLRYPLTQLDSASLCSTDSSSSSHPSSHSSTHSPLSPSQPTARGPHCDADYSNSQHGRTGQYGWYGPPAGAVPLTAASSRLSDAFKPDLAVPSLQPQLPPYFYPTVQSTIAAALQAAHPTSNPTLATPSHSSTVSPAIQSTLTSSTTAVATAKKHKAGPALLSDVERRLKHRIIDANRRRRETVLVERFAHLSGQRGEALARDRVSTLEVACDRYEELVRRVDGMQARMRCMEERLQVLDGGNGVTSDCSSSATNGNRRKSDQARTVRKRVIVNTSPVRRQSAQHTESNRHAPPGELDTT